MPANPPVAVIGLSAAGISAAMHLRASGHAVELVEIEDDLALRERFQIEDSQGWVSGEEYEFRALDALRQADVGVESGLRFEAVRWNALEEVQSMCLWNVLRNVSVERASTKIVMAANGKPSTSPWLEHPNCQKILGFTLSSSAWADARFFPRKRAVVIGDTAWALEQACQAAKHLDHVTIMTKAGSIDASRRLRAAVGDTGKISIVRNAIVTEILSNNEKVRSVVYSIADRTYDERCDVVFAAPRSNPDGTCLAVTIRPKCLRRKKPSLFAVCTMLGVSMRTSPSRPMGFLSRRSWRRSFVRLD